MVKKIINFLLNRQERTLENEPSRSKYVWVNIMQLTNNEKKGRITNVS